MIDNYAAFGWYSEWALLPISLLASIRIWLDHNPSKASPSDCIFVIQSRRKEEETAFADFDVFEGKSAGVRERLFLRGECKLTGRNGVAALKEALQQIDEQSEQKPPNALLLIAVYGEAQNTISLDAVTRALSQLSSRETYEIPGCQGCYVRGKLETRAIEVIVCDLARTYDFLALRLLGKSERKLLNESTEASVKALGQLLREIMGAVAVDNQALNSVIKGQNEVPLNLSADFWARLPVEESTLVELLLNPLDKVLHDFFLMSMRSGFHSHRWTYSLLHLSRLANHPDNELDEAIERTLNPMPLRLEQRRRGISVDTLLDDEVVRGEESVRVVIESRAGAGKSTMMGFLKWLDTQKLYHHRSFTDHPIIPLFLDVQGVDNLDKDLDLMVLLHSDRSKDFTDKKNVFTRSLCPFALGVLLATWKVDIFIDGFDHLRSNSTALDQLGEKLKEAGTRLRRLIITSRPGYQAAHLWQTNFMELKTRTIRNVEVDQGSIDDYAETWFKIVRSVARQAYDDRFDYIKLPREVAKDFRAYVGRVNPEFRDAVMSTPLLLTIAMATFFNAKKGTSDLQLSPDETALFESLFTETIPNQPGKDLWIDPKLLGVLSFALLMSNTSTLGAFSDASLIAIGPTPVTVGSWRAGKPLENVGILHFTDSEDGIREWTYIHPSFQEYLACRHFVEQIPAVSGADTIAGLQLDPVPPLQIVTTNGFQGTNLSNVFTRLGNQGLKFVLGRARLKTAKLARFLDWLAEDFGLQQYLYDTECLGPAKTELEQCLAIMDASGDSQGSTRRKALLRKLIGHYHYASFSKDGVSKNNLETVITLCGREEFVGSNWYRLFCHDHIQNRAAGAVRDIHAKSFEDLIASMGGMGSDLRLRCAHFAGHLGNQALRAIDRAEEPNLEWMTKQIDNGEAQYTAALELRALTFAECVTASAPAVLQEVRDGMLTVSGQASPLSEEGTGPGRASDPRERFMGPSQAIGDFAHQLVGRAAIRFWKVLEQRMRGGPDGERWQLEAEQDCSLARKYWQLANQKEILNVRGERVTKYVIYLAGTDARQDILRSPRTSWADHERSLRGGMNFIARDFHVSLPEENDSRDVVPGVHNFFNQTRRQVTE